MKNADIKWLWCAKIFPVLRCRKSPLDTKNDEEDNRYVRNFFDPPSNERLLPSAIPRTSESQSKRPEIQMWTIRAEWWLAIAYFFLLHKPKLEPIDSVAASDGWRCWDWQWFARVWLIKRRFTCRLVEGRHVKGGADRYFNPTCSTRRSLALTDRYKSLS